MIAAAIVIPLSGKIIGTHAQASSSTTSHFVVNANQDLPGLDTGIDLIVGSGITITASGQAQFSPDFTNDCNTTEETNPDGQRILLVGTLCPGKIDSGAVLPESPVGTLIANIGSSRWFAVGSSDGFTVATSGRLFLLYNDISGEYGNNSGSYQVTVTVTSAPPPVSISLAKAATPSVTPGGTITYTLTLTNTSPSGTQPLHDIQLADTPPTPAIVSISAPSTPIITPSGAASVNCSASTNHSLSCFVDDFAPGAKVIITFSATVSTNATGKITNTATAQSNTISAVNAKASTQVTVPHNSVAIFLQGINTALISKQIAKQINSGHKATSIIGMGDIPTDVSSTLPSNTQFFEYSYEGTGLKTGNPIPYNCQDTFSQPIATDISLLHQQIFRIARTEPKGTQTDIYLVGHSLGGGVAFGYVAFLEQHLIVPLPSGVHLKAVITLDSPIGGVHDFWTESYVEQKVYEKSCNLKNVNLESPSDLTTVLDATVPPFHTTPQDDGGTLDPLGARASYLMLSTPLPDPNTIIPSNENLAERAHTDLGTSFLTIGNMNDFVWHTQACNPLLPGFVETQWLEDEGNGSGIYGRSFASKVSTCPGLFSSKLADVVTASHFAVLFNNTNRDVQAGIKAFLTSPVGGTPDNLTPQPEQDTGPK